MSQERTIADLWLKKTTGYKSELIIDVGKQERQERSIPLYFSSIDELIKVYKRLYSALPDMQIDENEVKRIIKELENG